MDFVYWILKAFLSEYLGLVLLSFKKGLSLLVAETKAIFFNPRIIKYCASIPCIVFIRLASGLNWFSIITCLIPSRGICLSNSFSIAMPISTKLIAEADTFFTLSKVFPLIAGN